MPRRIQETRGSGSDLNSDAKRLHDPDNYRDKALEDSFPASDPPPTTPRVNWREKKDRAAKDQAKH